jgi:hypothetical protein
VVIDQALSKRRIIVSSNIPLLCRKLSSRIPVLDSQIEVTAASKRIDTNVLSVAILLPRRSPY